MASVIIGILTDALDADLPRRTFDDFAVAVAARCVIDALITNASLTVAAVKIFVTFGFRDNPGEC